MYRAIIPVGGYKIGEEVPTERAEHWLRVFAVPPVEKVKEEVATEEESEKDSEKKSEEKSEKKERTLGNILEDYLGRNQSVVKKNVSEDNLSKHQLKELLKLEESDKKRLLVINAIKQRLNEQ